MSRRDELLRRIEEKKKSRRRRLGWGLLLLVLLLLLLLCSRCTCAPPVEPELEPQPSEPVLEEPEPEPEPLPDRARIETIERPGFRNAPAEPHPWLDDFRLQVAARSPRLAACFVGAERPGRLRWTAAVDPTKGRVSQHEVEPVFLEDELSSAQEDCVIEVLSDPAYELDGEQGSTPSRVSLVIEF